jgi:hypothetical protein
MSDLDVTPALPADFTARLERFAELPGVEVRTLRALPTGRVAEAEILDAAMDLVPTLDPARLTALAELSPRRPWVDGVASLDFETVALYRASDAPFVSVGTFYSDAEFPPFVRLTLANAPTGNGLLVTCRADGIAIGPTFPGLFRVEGPGVAASFEDTGNPTTFMFVVPAGGSGPVEIKIHTDPDRIRLWAFYDCTITQL